ncbi:MAG: tripartite motif-containing protein 71 [Gaiellaceae bacterium]|nr:tripartite motif-containing protein 71 [Gaiellaceae bacterium]
MVAKRLRLALCVTVIAAILVLVAAALGSGDTFDRTWGKNVGGPGVAVCTVAANCFAGGQGGLGGEFNFPGAVATDSAGNVYVADSSNNRIEKFDSSGAFLLAWGKDVGGAGVEFCTVAASCQAGSVGGQGGEFAGNGPDGVATDASDNVYVTESSGNRVQKFSSSGTFLLAWGKNVGGLGVGICTVAASCQAGSSGALGGELFTPEGVAADASGVYVADFSNSRVQKFNSSGVFIEALGKNVGGFGTGVCVAAASCQTGTPGVLGTEFSRPWGVATDAVGNVYITDASEFRVQKFDSSLGFLRAWGKDVGGAGQDICTAAASCQNGSQCCVEGGDFNANGPAGVATDAAGNVYVANAAVGGRVQEFDSSGGFLQAWGKDVDISGADVCTVAADCLGGSAGVLGGQFATPVDVAIDGTGNLYVADYNNRRIQKFVAPVVLTQRTLTVTVTGSGNVTGSGIDCGGAGHTTCSESVADGTSITLTATPSSTFTGFTGGGCGAGNPCTVVMNADKTVNAAFSGPPSATVTTPADGASYASGSTVNASYSCSPGANGGALKAGAAGCSGPVANGSPIDTATVGSHAFAVTATDTDGQTATTTVHYTVTAAPPGPPATPPPGSPATPPGPPSVTVTTPASGAIYPFASVVNASYSCSPGANGGVLKPGTAGCSAPVANGSPIDTVAYGDHAFTVTATDTDGQTATITRHYTLDYSIKYPTPVRPQHPKMLSSPIVDIRVTGIEVTQAIQAVTCNCAGTLPNRVDPFAKTPGRAAYEGVTMAAGKYTVVRVFAHFTGVSDPTATGLRGATATLRIFDSSEREISAPLSPDISPSALTRPDCIACVTEAERANPTAGFLFLVPWDETYHRSLSFRATVSPPTGLAAPVQCGGCNANVFTLRGVPFASTADVNIYPIPLTVEGVRTSKSEDQVFDSAQSALPVNVLIHPYEAPLAVDGATPAQAAALVGLRALVEGRQNSQYPIGVYNGNLGGSGGVTLGGRVLFGNQKQLLAFPAPPISVVRDTRPLTSVMHEIGHGLGLMHADTGSGPNATDPHPDGTPDCKGNSGGQVGEAWPPDNEGRIQGIGFDLRNWTARILDENHPALGDAYYDFMSYCGPFSSSQEFEGNHWISVRNWSRLIAFQPPPQGLPLDRRPRAAGVRAAGDAPLLVMATLDSAGKMSIFDVTPGLQTGAEPTAGSVYRIELRDGTGRTLARVVPATEFVHSDGQRPGLLLEANLPFVPSAASVVVSDGGVEVARRARSAHAPDAAIVSPRPGSRVGQSAATLVHWTARDVDGDPLTAAVDYSADGGRHWKVVAANVTGESVSVPSRMLSASGNARLRVRVSDGFDVSTAISGVLQAAGASPAVHIIGGTPGGRMRADAMLLLRGRAYDDAGIHLTGRRLRWYAGRRLLGRGELLTVHGLPAGTTSIRLVATDARGRSAQTRLPLKVIAVRPKFLIARAPKRLAPGARRVRIVVASNVPAVLTIAGRRYAVGRTPRALTIAIKRGRAPLQLAYALSSRGGVTRGTYIAAR